MLKKKFSCIIIKHTLQFNFNARTSRGALDSRNIFLIEISDNFGRYGVGEISPLEGLSNELNENFDKKLDEVSANIDFYLNNLHELKYYPSILFGIESAWESYKNKNGIFFKTEFTQNYKSIPINSLVWMGDFDYMQSQINNHIKNGTKCIKLKIGGIDFESECELIKNIREQKSAKELDIRLDINGAFEENEALEKINFLSQYDIHSIEQPIKKGNYKEMKMICQKSQVAIALDEELTDCYDYKDKLEMLREINPHFIVIKPSLHGGIKGSSEWIFLAKQMGVGWWVTSALESNLGLSFIAQWVSQYSETYGFCQGLGTGNLYNNNFASKLLMKNNSLFFNSYSL